MNSKDFKKVAKELCKKIVNIENTECIICLEEIKIGTLLMPCVHYQFCLKCSAMFTECPVCRTDINYILHYNRGVSGMGTRITFTFAFSFTFPPPPRQSC